MSIEEKLANVVCHVKSTHTRSKEDSHLKSINIHKNYEHINNFVMNADLALKFGQ